MKYPNPPSNSDKAQEPAASSTIMESFARTGVPSNLSSTDALWTLIMNQPEATRRILTERLLSEDIETGERLLLKVSIERGWQQVKELQQSGKNKSSLQDLITELENG